jgi:hypothetical protein
MWNKIYSVALAVFVLVMLALTYLTYSQLQSFGFAPSVIADSYLAYDNYYLQFLLLSAVLLLIPANVLLWTEKKSWALWATLSYFAFFILLQGWWLSRVFSAYRLKNNLTQDSISFGILVSAIICLVAAIGIFFNQFLILRLRERMYGAENSADEILVKEDFSDEKS